MLEGPPGELQQSAGPFRRGHSRELKEAEEDDCVRTIRDEAEAEAGAGAQVEMLAAVP